jgi:hypothetical protein
MFTIDANSSDMRRLNSALNELARETKKTLKDVLPAQMRLLASDLAFVTRPKGRAQADKQATENALMWKIADVYPHPGRIVNQLNVIANGLGGRFANLLRRRKFSECKAITDKHLPGMRLSVGVFDFGQLHESMRWKRNVTHRLVVADYPKVNAYFRKEMKQVGFAKGGFATGARQLGGVRGIPQFASRHKAPGSGRVIESGDKLSVILTNDVDYLPHALQGSAENAAVNHRARQVGNVLKRIQDRKVKNTTRKANS